VDASSSASLRDSIVRALQVGEKEAADAARGETSNVLAVLLLGNAL